MPEITWWGHATATIADSGVRILTDPVLTRSVGHLQRRRGPAPTAQASNADLVLVSHLHGDHLHLRSLLQISHRIPIVVPIGTAKAVRALRLLRHHNVIEVGVGEVLMVGTVLVHVVPAHHDARRHVFARHGSAPPLGYLVEGEKRTYFAGDTDLYPEMADEVGRCDVALLPVGGWGPGLGPGHLNSATAATAALLLGADHVVPIHFGTLWPIGMDRFRPDEFYRPGADFVSSVGLLAPRVTAHLLRPGQTVGIT